MPDGYIDIPSNASAPAQRDYIDTPMEPERHQPSWITRQVEGALGLPAGAFQQAPETISSLVNLVKKHPAASSAMVAGAATAPLTGGMSLAPAMAFSGLMAAGGAAAGLTAHDIANRNTPENIPTSTESAKQIGMQGLMGAGGEGIGRGIQTAAKAVTPAVSQWLYKLGLRPSTSMQRNYPSAIKTGLQEDILPDAARIQSRLSEVENDLTRAVAQYDAARPKVRGLLPPAQGSTVTETIPLAPSAAVSKPVRGPNWPETAEDYVEWTAERIRNKYATTVPKAEPSATQGVMLRDRTVPPKLAAPEPGTAPPTMIAAKDIAEAAKNFVLKKGKLADRGLKAEDLAALEDLAKRYISENSAPMTVAQSLAQKRAEQALASSAYKTEARGGQINQLETLWHQGVANAQRQQVLDRIPSAKDALATEQGLIGLKDMAQVAADRPDVLGRYLKVASALGGVLGGHPEAGLGMAALMAAVESPTLAGASALAIKKLGKGATSSMVPQVMKALASAYGGASGGW